MARRRANHTAVKEFLDRLASDPDLLGKFILDPDGVMRQHGITTSANREHVKKAVALGIVNWLLVGDHAFHVHAS